ncbi:MAG: hypothetical protein JHC26_09610 [Thermofilum sp.]|uniref:hypothetical protein n=1 Tax=Thermofilum sp. TaxID=1961369 RepID=UPI0025853F80|nr:hypothetical protein [Thermofilum sp.]MCI4409337.1 hypothetical protein [Thermofilum sp.]
MNEKIKRIIVASMLVMSAIIVLCVGAFIVWKIYVVSGSSLWNWTQCDCCYGTCECDIYPLNAVWFASILGVATLSVMMAMWLFASGYAYYKYGHFRRNKKDIEDDAVGWGE